MVYPTGMAYLHDVVCVLCGLLLSQHDIRIRRVPRMWVAVCLVLQNLAVVIAYIYSPASVFSRLTLFRSVALLIFPRSSVQNFAASNTTVLTESTGASRIVVLFATLGVALALSLLQAGIMLLLALIRPGSLGFGDVTATLLFTNALAMHGVWQILVWWLASGIFGSIALWLWNVRNKSASPFQSHESHANSLPSTQREQTLAFVPILYAGTIASLLLQFL